ncbi:MAG: hypothetical protein ACJ8J0_13340 [Longimicrobiaceae bacterium]
MPPRPAPAPPPQIPVGYMLLGMVLVVIGIGCAAVAAVTGDVTTRALFASVGILSLLLVEALWFMRPWVARAMDAWAAACVGSVLIPVFQAAGTGELDLFVTITLAALVLVGFPCATARWYVRNRARRLGLLPGPVP